MFYKRAAVKLGICTCIKNERPYLREWISHYRSLGFNTIFVYDNESTDGSAELLSRLAGSDLKVISWPTPADRSPQLTAFEHCAASAGSKVDFLAFFDADELLVETQIGALRKTLGGLGSSLEGILINQRVVGSNGQKTYKPLPVMDRFSAISAEDYQENVWVKSIVRPEAVKNFHNPHIPVTKKSRFASADGKRIEPNMFSANGQLSVANHKTLALNHYILKSYEEFLWKRNRGGGASASPEARMSRYQDRNFFLNRQMTVEKKEAIAVRSTPTQEQINQQLALGIDDLRRMPPRWVAGRPLLSPAQRDWLLQQMKDHDMLIDYGASESVIDGIYAGLRAIVAVHSSLDTVNKLASDPVLAAAKDVGRLSLVHADIGPVDDFGNPRDFSKSHTFNTYYESAWAPVKDSLQPDKPPLVLVTGRFRVACACYSAFVSPNSPILLRDFSDRPQYEALMEVFEVRQIIDGAAVLSLKVVDENSIRAVLEKFALNGL